MGVYIITVLLIVMLGTLQTSQNSYYIDDNSGEQRCYVSRFSVFLLASVLIFVGGFRFDVGTDYYNYLLMNPTIAQVLDKIRAFDEPIVYMISYACRQIWHDGAFSIIVEQIITVGLIFIGLRRFRTESYTLPLLLYIFYCGWLFSFNGVRQAMACSFVFAFAQCPEKSWIRRIIHYAIVCFIAFLMHRTAILMFPVLLFCNRKFSGKQIGIMLAFALSFRYLGDYAYQFLGGTAENVGSYATTDINLFRVLVAFAPAIFCIYSLMIYDDDFIEENSFLLNMVVLHAMLTLATRNSAYLHRFSYFTSLYSMCLIPKFEKYFSNQMFFRFMVVVLYFVFFLRDIRGCQFYWIFGRFGLY